MDEPKEKTHESEEKNHQGMGIKPGLADVKTLRALVPGPQHPHREEFLPHISSPSPLLQLKPIPPCPITTLPDKQPLPIFPVGPFRYWKAAVRSPRSLSHQLWDKKLSNTLV